MKIQLTFKTPDALTDALCDVFEDRSEDAEFDKLHAKLSREYFMFGEYVNIEITINDQTGNVINTKVLRN